MTMSIIELMHQIVKEPAPRLGPEGRFSKDAEAFVDACLMKDVDERRTPGELIVSLLLLRHYFLHFWDSPISLRFACSLASHLHLALPSSLPRIYALSSSLFSSCSIFSLIVFVVLMKRTRSKWLGYNNAKRARRISRPGSRTFNHRSHLLSPSSLTRSILPLYALFSMHSR
jgi:hypothetical protein